MDFSHFDMTGRLGKFRDDVLAFLAQYDTPEARERARTNDDGYLSFYLALGARGWIMPRWPVEMGGANLTAEEEVILQYEMLRADVPTANLMTTRMMISAVAEFAREPLRTEVLREAAAGRTRICLGYTEPDGGSDIATVKTYADRDGDDWIINGTKVYTSGAHHCRYTFLLTCSDRTGPRHRNLTMFLMPLQLPGVTVRPLQTLGERSNTVYYDDVRVADIYRLGEVNRGWTVLSKPLAIEHGISGDGGRVIGDMTLVHGAKLALALDHAVSWARRHTRAGGPPPSDDPVIRERLARIALHLEAATATWGKHGRVAVAETLIRDVADLVDMLGSETSIMGGDEADSDAVAIGAWHRKVQVTSIYGGTVEVFKNMIGQDLGLPRQLYKN